MQKVLIRMKLVGFFRKKKVLLALGLIFATLLMVPFMLLGTGSIVKYHDQLDGEIFGYILGAKYLFQNVSSYPEIMKGLPVEGQVPPAVLFVPLYRIFAPFTAFMITQWLIRLVAFSGMFLLFSEIFDEDKHFLSFIISCIFMFLPFYPVYGFCIPGQPFLLYSILRKEKKGKIPLIVISAVIYGLGSSLVLVGFAVLIELGVFWIVSLLRKKKALALNTFVSAVVLSFTYVISNVRLILQVLGLKQGYVSNRVETVAQPAGFFDLLRSVLGDGTDYAQAFAKWILVFAAAVGILLVLILIFDKERAGKINKSHVAVYLVSLCALLATACLFSLFNGKVGCDIRNGSTGLLHQVNLSRFSWTMPLFWCLLAYASGRLLIDVAGVFNARMLRFAAYTVLVAVLALWGLRVAVNSTEKPDVAKLIKGRDSYIALDWDRFFASDVFEQIDAAIGKPKESYHVVSLGIYPAAAAFNGFYTLDGYSNNYDLDYKHEFRKVIAPELDRNEYCRLMFDTWGNRCYLYTAEQYDYFEVQKTEGRYFLDLQLDFDALKALGCDYIFSASPIIGHEERNLELLQGSPFATDKSWYQIYVYRLK